MMARVLVVDDKPENHAVVGAILEDAGFEVVAARTGAEAIAAVQADAIDIVLMDVMLAGEDGYLLTRRLHRLPGCELLPVIFLSALDTTNDVVRGYNAGGLGYIPRMTDAALVVAIVRRFVALSRVLRG